MAEEWGGERFRGLCESPAEGGKEEAGGKHGEEKHEEEP